MIKIIYNVCFDACDVLYHTSLTLMNLRVEVVTETGSVYPRRH